MYTVVNFTKIFSCGDADFEAELGLVYKRVTVAMEKRGIKFVFARPAQYGGGTLFKEVYYSKGGPWEILTDIHTDAVYIKSPNIIHLLDKEVLTISERGLEEINTDKWKMYQELAEFMAPTFPLSRENWQTAIQNIKTEYCIIKPVDGSLGVGIIVKPVRELIQGDLIPEKRYIVQELIDSSKGMPGSVVGRHDIRVLVFNGKITPAFMSIAQDNSYLANLSRGARKLSFSFDDIPERGKEMIDAIEKKLSRFFPRVYSIDFLFDPEGKPYLIEINTGPGYPYPVFHQDEYINKIDDMLADAFVESLEKAK